MDVDGESSTTESTAGTTTSSTTADPDEPVSSDDPTSSVPTTSTTTTTVAGAQIRCTTAASGDGADALSMEACGPDRARVGDTVVVTIKARDGDARVRDDCASPFVDWGDGEQAVCDIGCVASGAPSAPSSIEVTREHMYTEPGRYPIRIVVESDCGQDPYGDTETAELTIEVT